MKSLFLKQKTEVPLLGAPVVTPQNSLSRNATSASRPARKPKNNAKKKTTWGGRPKGSGSGRSPNSRKNRVAVMFTDTEVSKLQALATKQNIPVATIAYNLIARSLVSCDGRSCPRAPSPAADEFDVLLPRLSNSRGGHKVVQRGLRLNFEPNPFGAR